MVGGLHNLWEQHGSLHVALSDLRLMSELNYKELGFVNKLDRLYREIQEAEDSLYALEAENELVPLWALEAEYDCD